MTAHEAAGRLKELAERAKSDRYSDALIGHSFCAFADDVIALCDAVPQWRTIDSPRADKFERCLFGHWQDGKWKWIVSGFWGSDDQPWYDGEDENAFLEQPTHFAPLPSPPEAGE